MPITHQQTDLGLDWNEAQTTTWQLIHGDCVEGMKKLPTGSVDVVITSPPYNLGINYSSFDDRSERQDYLQWCVVWAREVKRVLAEDGSFFLNVGAVPSNPLFPHQVLLALSPEYFVLQNTFHWIKSITVEPKTGGEVSAGHFKPINSKRFVNDCHEYVFHFSQSGSVSLNRRAIGVQYVHKSNIGRWGHTGGQDRRCRGNTWFIPYETIQNRNKERPHPATFPAKLAEMCIRILDKPAQQLVVMDPFLGIGHAAIAAQAMGVKEFVGFEIDAGYLAEAKMRLEVA